jgi:UDP-N-acetylglucosamine 2-epimerase (non-hydrolysing)
MKKMKVLLVAAARPNFMKVAPIYKELCKFPEIFEAEIIHTGQHYDQNMNELFFEQLGIGVPETNLNVGSDTHAKQTAQCMIRFEDCLLAKKPDLVIVVGDVNSTVACTLTCAKLSIKVAHVEAGLRSFDRNMPEEINRIVTDAIADYLFTPSQDADKQLEKEGISKDKIVFVGNVMIDTLMSQENMSKNTHFHKELGLDNKSYALLTLHRPSNVDKKEKLAEIIEALTSIAQKMTIIYPVHPRTKKMIEKHGLKERFNENDIKKNAINIIEPIGYLEMLNLTMNAAMVFTDSGGLQEETSYLKVPCITIRNNTERPITLEEGTNILAGTTKEGILAAYEKAVFDARNIKKFNKQIQYWDGLAAKRIVEFLKSSV